MNIFKRFKLDNQIHKLIEIVDINFNRFETFYKSNFQIVSMDVLPIHQKRLFHQAIREQYSFGLKNMNENKVLLYNAGKLQEFETINMQLGEEFNQLLQLFEQAEFNIDNSKWAMMIYKYEKIINDLNTYVKFEK